MKYFLVLLSILFVLGGIAQDTLIFKNGTIISVKIVEIQDAEKLIQYQNDGQTMVVAQSALKAIFYQNQWTQLNYPDFEMTHDAVESPLRKKRAFPYSRGKFSIGTNLTSATIGFINSEWWLLSSRPLFTIEPEYQLVKNKLSIKVPLEFGLPRKFVESVNWTDPNSYVYTYEIYDPNPHGSYRLTQVYGSIPDFSPNENSYGDHYYYDDYEYYFNPKGRARHISFQGGLILKWFPLKSEMLPIYISQGFFFGIADHKAITFYDHIDSASFYDYWDGPWVQGYTFLNETRVVVKNPFPFLRYEGAVGLNINLSKSITLSGEFAISSKIQNKGKIKDKVYLSYNGGPYEFMGEFNYPARRNSWIVNSDRPNRPLLRLRLIYHFGAARIIPKKKKA